MTFTTALQFLVTVGSMLGGIGIVALVASGVAAGLLDTAAALAPDREPQPAGPGRNPSNG